MIEAANPHAAEQLDITPEACGIEPAEPAVTSRPLTDAEWMRVLGGQPYRVLVKPEQLAWAGERAVRCITCAHAPGETHDPWWAWCIATRTLVSNMFPKLCPRYERRAT